MKVWNISQGAAVPEGAVYVGRTSPFGNPFRIGRDGTREQVIAKFRSFVLARPCYITEAKKALRGKDLMCHCAPYPCHADVLLEIANS